VPTGIPVNDRRTDADIARELEQRTHQTMSDLVISLGKGPIPITPRELEVQLIASGLLRPRPPEDKGKQTVIDNVTMRHPQQADRFITDGMVGRSDVVARAKAAGEQEHSDQLRQNIGSLGAAMGGARLPRKTPPPAAPPQASRTDQPPTRPTGNPRLPGPGPGGAASKPAVPPKAETPKPGTPKAETPKAETPKPPAIGPARLDKVDPGRIGGVDRSANDEGRPTLPVAEVVPLPRPETHSNQEIVLDTGTGGRTYTQPPVRGAGSNGGGKVVKITSAPKALPSLLLRRRLQCRRRLLSLRRCGAGPIRAPRAPVGSPGSARASPTTTGRG
jgi:hypothetical protein